MVALDETNKLSKKLSLNYGLRAQTSNNKAYQNTFSDDGKPLTDGTSSVDNNERIYDVYAGFSAQLSQELSLQASAEVENYHSPIWNRWHVYPTVNMTWMVDNNNMLNLSFNSDSKYPSYWSVMSSVYYSSTYSEIWGNPQLKPSSYYSTSLLWQLKHKYTFVASVSFEPDYFVQLPYQTSERMAVIMSEQNWNYHNTFGLMASAQFAAGHWLTGNASASAIYVHDKSDHFFDLPFDRNQLNFVLAGTASVKLLPKENLRLIINPFYQNRGIQGVYDIDHVFSMNATLRWASANDRWSVALQGNNVFNNKMKATSTQGNQDYGMTLRTNWASATLMLTYRFGNYKQKNSRKTDTSRMGH